MNIILVSKDLGKVKTINLSGAQAAMIAGFMLLLMGAVSAGFQKFIFSAAATQKEESLVLGPQDQTQREQEPKHDSYVRENLNAMAIKLGQMQAQLLRLDSLGERLAKLSGIKAQEFSFDQAPGWGGAVSVFPTQDLSLPELGKQVDELARRVDDRFDKLGVLESMMMQDRLSKKMLPSVSPVESGWYSSKFGWRIDPFTGKKAFHEGLDFNADTGTGILAAAGGIVVYSGFHPEYGNMIEIDHGNDLVSRYAHASKRGVKVGEVVLRGQKIGEVGSTGRSTGSHLHFEIRHRGVPQNPARFLQARN